MKRVRLTLDLEIRADIPADACTYFIERFGIYFGEDYKSSGADQVERVILDMLHLHLPQLLGDWQVSSSFVEVIDGT